MPFRCTRWSNDARTWGWIAAMVCVIGTLLYASHAGIFSEDSILPLGCFLVFLLVGLVLLSREVLFPYEMELVIDEVEIRWGLTARPARQKRIALKTIKKIVVDVLISADTGGMFSQDVGIHVLTGRQYDQFLRYLSQYHPEIPICNVDGTPHLIDTAS